MVKGKKSLRDEIAIAAMSACLIGDEVLKPDDFDNNPATVSLEKISKWSYELADAMLEAREE